MAFSSLLNFGYSGLSHLNPTQLQQNQQEQMQQPIQQQHQQQQLQLLDSSQQPQPNALGSAQVGLSKKIHNIEYYVNNLMQKTISMI